MQVESVGVALLAADGAVGAAGLFAGFLRAGMFGIGGGFVVVPAMLALVLPLLGRAAPSTEYAHVAVGTSAATIIAASLRSVTAHAKRGAVDFQILRAWAPWLIIGAVVGVVLQPVTSTGEACC